MSDPRTAAVELAARRSAVPCFRDGVPYLRALEFGDDVVLACPALGVSVALSGDRADVEDLFLRSVRAAVRDVDPATAPGDAVATALAVERASEDELRRWIRPRDPALEFETARREAVQRARDQDPWWQLHQPIRGWRR